MRRKTRSNCTGTDAGICSGCIASSAYDIAAMYAELGDKEQAFEWLNTSYQERDTELMGLKTDSSFDPIRSDPRFAKLVRKVGLPQ
jgi:hypothetical protein